MLELDELFLEFIMNPNNSYIGKLYKDLFRSTKRKIIHTSCSKKITEKFCSKKATKKKPT